MPQYHYIDILNRRFQPEEFAEMEADDLILLKHISKAQNNHCCMVSDKSGKTELQQGSSSNGFSGDIELDTGNSDYICSCCQKSFKTFWGIQRHVRTNHHSEENRCPSQLTSEKPSIPSMVQEIEHRLLRRELVRQETNELTIGNSEYSEFHEMDISDILTAEGSDKIEETLDKSDCSSLNMAKIVNECKGSGNGLKVSYQPQNSTERLCDLTDIAFGTSQSLHHHHHHRKCHSSLKHCQVNQGLYSLI